MRRLFFRKQVELTQGFEEFLGCIQRSIELFSTAMVSYLEHGPGQSLERASILIDKAESEADDLRREIERSLYKNELLPDSRGDLLQLLEWCDRVVNFVEHSIRNVCIWRVQIPAELTDDIRELLVPMESCVNTMLAAVRLLFKDPARAKPAIDDCDRLESECDRIEQAAKRRIYAMDIDLAHKMQLERLIYEISAVADRAEDTCQFLEIICIKRTL